MANIFRARLGLVDKKQVELLAEVKKRGFSNLDPHLFSCYANGHSDTPQAKAVIAVANRILDEWERQNNQSA